MMFMCDCLCVVPSSGVLQETMAPIVNPYLCDYLTGPGSITANMICAGYLHGGPDTCQVHTTLWNMNKYLNNITLINLLVWMHNRIVCGPLHHVYKTQITTKLLFSFERGILVVRWWLSWVRPGFRLVSLAGIRAVLSIAHLVCILWCLSTRFGYPASSKKTFLDLSGKLFGHDYI